jgi:small subunit ribosomal protein S1
VTCTVAGVQDNGIEVTVGEGLHAFIRRGDLARDRSEQRPDKFAVGDKVDAQVTNFDKASRKLGLSIKAREIAEEKEAVAQYGSSDSGASLGDILGAAISKAREEAKTDDEEEAEVEAEAEAEADEGEEEAKPAKKAKAKAKAEPEADAEAEAGEGEEEAKPAKPAKKAKATKAKTTKSKSKAKKEAKDDAAEDKGDDAESSDEG